MKLETNFEKKRHIIVILKIVEATPQLVQNLTPTRKLFCVFILMLLLLSTPPLTFTKTKKVQGAKMDHHQVKN